MHTTKFKLKVVQHADNCNNNSQIAREFNVPEKQVWDWQKVALDLAEMPQAKKAGRVGKPSFPQKELALKYWICDHRQQRYVVTCGIIRMKVKQMINNESFRASSHSCQPKIYLDTLLILVHLICGFDSMGAYWS